MCPLANMKHLTIAATYDILLFMITAELESCFFAKWWNTVARQLMDDASLTKSTGSGVSPRVSS